MDPWCFNTGGLYPCPSTWCGKPRELPPLFKYHPEVHSANFLVADQGCMESHYLRQTSVPADCTQGRGGLAYGTVCCSRGPLLNPWIPSSRWSEALHCTSDRHRPRRSKYWPHALPALAGGSTRRAIRPSLESMWELE